MRGHIRKRHTWEFIVDVGRHPVTGVRRQKSKSGFPTKRTAESALHEFTQGQVREVIGFDDGDGTTTSKRFWANSSCNPSTRGVPCGDWAL